MEDQRESSTSHGTAVRDNAANIVKAMRDGSFSDLGCFAHMLQLIVHDGVLSQKIVTDTLASAHRIVSHFKCSPLAYGNTGKFTTACTSSKA